MPANSSTALVGRNGAMTVGGVRVARLTEWSVAENMATKSEWGDSDSAGFTNRAAGRKDGTFTANGKFDTANEQFNLFDKGDIVQATLFLQSGLYYYFPRAMCLDFHLQVNIDSQEVIGWTSAWGADGAYTKPGEGGQPASVLPAAY